MPWNRYKGDVAADGDIPEDNTVEVEEGEQEGKGQISGRAKQQSLCSFQEKTRGGNSWCNCPTKK